MARIGASRPGVGGATGAGSAASCTSLGVFCSAILQPYASGAESPLPVSAACSAVRRPLTSQRCRSGGGG